MWAHQYLQAVNEISAVKADPHVWTHDGDMAETYGLEPNYGCCTANFNQGWPKFANMLIQSTHDGGAAVVLYAPAHAVLPNNAGTVDVSTDYPFGDSVIVTVNNTGTAVLPLYLRIPSWADKATINGKQPSANGKQTAANGTMSRIACPVGSTVYTLEFNPEIRLERWTRTDPTGRSNASSYSVHRGALMYSLPLSTNFTMYAHHFGTDDMSSDYYVTATTPWNYALDIAGNVATCRCTLKASSPLAEA
jgi:hypothetical protein